ncbi:DUF4202 domain-containing protein [Fontivita pretiosa]|uniref:DUF4202 domain-containing protein n=1 Tax=Fontivita pretiosa TaxID=2989684 RepID=UPI003D1727F5
MNSDPERFRRAIERFDAANAQDPNQKELLYAQRMTHWLDRLDPNASEALRLAARCQHICRWQIPRSSFPMDRIGYLKWRKTLYQFHADKAGQILREVGYDDATIARVQSLLRKEKLKLDPEMQTLEDVICLVFLEHYFAEFVQEHAHDEPKILNIIRKTWAKMSPRGHEAAMSIKLPQSAMRLISQALSQPPQTESESAEPA